MIKKYTGERLETYIYSKSTIDHLHRYAIASKFIKDKIVLDIASGEGYGSNLMSKDAAFVYGVDIDKTTVENAKLKYKKENLQFLVGNTSAIPLENNSVDIVISFETVEHHNEHDEMMLEIKRVLKPSGMLIISTPDKLTYSDKRNYKNEFHVKELYKQEFKNLIANYFENYQLLNQSYINGNSLVLDEKNESEAVIFTGEYSLLKEINVDSLYLVIIASDVIFNRINMSIFDGGQVLNLYVVNTMTKNIYDSNSYRVGHFILLPFKILKRFIRNNFR
jgi:ubiquinone/menaquinone biosynthesis C-methylase UbiE